MVVVAVEKQDLNGRLSEALRAFEPAKTRSDDHNPLDAHSRGAYDDIPEPVHPRG